MRGIFLVHLSSYRCKQEYFTLYLSIKKALNCIITYARSQVIFGWIIKLKKCFYLWGMGWLMHLHLPPNVCQTFVYIMWLLPIFCIIGSQESQSKPISPSENISYCVWKAYLVHRDNSYSCHSTLKNRAHYESNQPMTSLFPMWLELF